MSVSYANHAFLCLHCNRRALFALSTELLPDDQDVSCSSSGCGATSSGSGSGITSTSESGVDSSSHGMPGGYVLQLTGRYAHSPAYIRRVAAQTGWSVTALQSTMIRMNAGKPIHGNLCVLQRLSTG